MAEFNPDNHCIVYLLHFWEGMGPIQHYTGATRNLKRRLGEHFGIDGAGRGAGVTARAQRERIDFTVVRLWVFPDWKSAIEHERRVKNGPTRGFCPICVGPNSNPRELAIDRPTWRPNHSPTEIAEAKLRHEELNDAFRSRLADDD